MESHLPNTSYEYGRRLATCEDEDRVVISGISGSYPSCENITELAKALFDRKDLITDIPELKFSVGRIKNVGKFDAQFFGITPEHADYMDPMCRILLEKAYEAITDSGFNMNHFKGTTMGVYVANCTSDAEVESTYRTDIRGALICERAQSFLANRISYWLGINGPSCTVNTACSSSLYAMELAYKAIRNGECDAALVGASNLSLAPGMVNLYVNLGITSARCRSFDNAANGFCRSEAISVVLLQKAKHARRVYAQVVHIKTNNDGYKKQTILFPSATMQKKLINEVYEECGVPKCCLSWVEAHGTGTRIGDYQEMTSLRTLCENRTTTLLCGCVKSSIGHTEATSGLCSIAKVIIAMEHGLIPPNINFHEPQKGIKALQENKIQIITETTPWSGGYVAVNNFGIGGSNAHLLLNSNRKKPNNSENKDLLYLVAVSGRTTESVKFITSYLNSIPINPELINLLQQIHNAEIPNHIYRGYTILGKGVSAKIEHTKKIDPIKRPIWLIYPGMGSQWVGMARELMKIDCFKKSIQECDAILAKKNIDLLEILTTNDSRVFLSILNCFVGITAMMISFTDLLEAIGVQFSGLVGHSFGEIGCAYADKCLTKKQALKVAYYRGITSTEMKTINGAMAAVGLDTETMKLRSPSSVEVACKNGTESCTISGPADAVREVIRELKTEDIFATEVYSGGIAYHSRYIRLGAPIYLKYLQNVIREPRERSSKWISTSIDAERVISIGKQCSAEYFVNNFLQPVDLEKALQQIPQNAITIEMAPHSILKYVLNNTLNDNTINISLLNKNYLNTLQYFLISLGTLYEQNVDMDLTQIYPPVEYPVSRGTPMIAPLIKWFHDEDWHVPFQNMDFNNKNSSHGKSIRISYDDDKFLFLQDCVINGINMFPESGYLTMVWDTFTEQQNNGPKTSVIFSNINFHKTVAVPSKGSLNFSVIITHLTSYFEVLLGDEVICDGYIETIPEEFNLYPELQESFQEKEFVLQSDDIYKEFKIKGYSYSNNFHTISRSNLEGTIGKVKWTKDWILYLDALLQYSNFSKATNSFIELISTIKTLKIDLSRHVEYSKKYNNEIPITLTQNNIYSGGVTIKGLKTRPIQREPCETPVLQKFQFVPYFNDKILPLQQVIRILTTIILENTLLLKLKIIEYLSPDLKIPLLSKEFDDFFQTVSFFELDVTIEDHPQLLESLKLPSYFKIEKISWPRRDPVDVFVLPNLKKNIKTHLPNLSALETGTFVISREKKRSSLVIEGLEITATFSTNEENIILWRKTPVYATPKILHMKEDSFAWVTDFQKMLKNNRDKIIIYSEGNSISGMIGFYKCIRREPCGHNLRCFLVLDDKAPSFSVDDIFYQNQIKNDLAINVYKDGTWGSYIPLEMDPLTNINIPYACLEIFHKKQQKELKWVQGKFDQNIQTKDDKDSHIRIHYATLPHNHFNSKSAIEHSTRLYEFSGTTTEGNVVGISLSNKICNFISKDDCIYWTIPPQYSLEQGLTFPIAYLTALIIHGEVKKLPLKTIWVQNGLADISQATIWLFSKYNYSVMTIEKNSIKRDQVESKFPKVCSFLEDSISNIKEKIDILLVTEFHPCLLNLIDFLNPGAHVFYVGHEKSVKLQCIENIILRGIRFQVIDLTKSIDQGREKIMELRDNLDNEIKTGSVQPLERNSTQITIPGLLKSMETDETIKLVIHGDKKVQRAIPRFICDSDHVYIICGGLGGMGFELADWLIEKGAEKLILVSRMGNCNRYQLRKISKWQSRGIFVKITTDNIAKSEGVENLLKSANQMGVVAAIFNTTLILQDGLFENLNQADFQTVANPKAIATKHLDALSRTLCPHLKHFVVFSSIVCGYGNAGQTNYGYANSVIERLCEQRKSQGLPALAIEWAGVGDVGYLKNTGLDKLPSGTSLQPIRSCLQTLEFYLCQSEPVVSSFVVMKNKTTTRSKYNTAFTKIKVILDRADPEIPDNTTLKDIGLDSITVTETRLILEQKYAVVMSSEDVLNLKLNQLWKIEKQPKILENPKESSAIRNISILEQLYINLLESLRLETDLTHLPTLVRLESYLHEGKTHFVSTDQEPTIFFLPSIEGVAGVMQPLAQLVDLQVLCAQYNMGEFEITKIASKIFEEVEVKLKPNQEFHIVGYSFGGLIAMEIVHLLEQQGKTGYLYMIDSSPTIVKSISDHLFKNHEFYHNVLGFVRALKSNLDLQKFQEKLRSFKDWESALKYTMQSLPDNLPIKKENLEIILNTSYRRNEAIQSYDGIPKQSLKSKVLFFKPKESLFPMPTSNGLSEYCELPVEEYIINGNHFTMLKTTELAHYIMSFYRQTSNKIKPL